MLEGGITIEVVPSTILITFEAIAIHGVRRTPTSCSAVSSLNRFPVSPGEGGNRDPVCMCVSLFAHRQPWVLFSSPGLAATVACFSALRLAVGLGKIRPLLRVLFFCPSGFERTSPRSGGQRRRAALCHVPVTAMRVFAYSSYAAVHVRVCVWVFHFHATRGARDCLFRPL